LTQSTKTQQIDSPTERSKRLGKIEETIKSEIIRLARKELNATIVPLQKEIRDLKRTVSRLEKSVSAMEKSVRKMQRKQLKKTAELTASEKEIQASRISGRVIKNLRKKLGISQGTMAILLDVSLSAVASWESGRIKPRGKNKAAIVALRKLGRRDVKKILERKKKEA
jgi:DNA-binding transcriptional regulator YiaG